MKDTSHEAIDFIQIYKWMWSKLIRKQRKSASKYQM